MTAADHNTFPRGRYALPQEISSDGGEEEPAAVPGGAGRSTTGHKPEEKAVEQAGAVDSKTESET